MKLQTVCLLNDSFPPLIDGVANAVMNYADILHNRGMDSVVITPNCPGSEDSGYPYPVLRYPGIDLRKQTGYMAGIPFSPDIARQLEGKNVSLLHSHCPIVSTMLARELRQILDVPLILTYHTKFDIDIANLIHSRTLQAGSKRALLENINACDEVWAVSEGAAENLRALGYEGDCVIMRNGVDFPMGRVGMDAVQAATAGYDLPEGVPVFLFVGRIMWYKGLQIIEDALARLNADGMDFRMVFIGGGGDLEEVKAYADSCGITPKCIFTGPIHDRALLRAWYCRGDLFLFPSTFDTNGLVVREAAACSLPSMLIAGSCAAEGITDGRNGFLIEENAESMYRCLKSLTREKMASVGLAAGQELYISWETAVHAAMERYEIVVDRYKSGSYAPYRNKMEPLFKANGELMEGLARLQEHRQALRRELTELVSEERDRLHGR